MTYNVLMGTLNPSHSLAHFADFSQIFLVATAFSSIVLYGLFLYTGLRCVCGSFW